MPQFDIQGARKAGYSDDEIISHLAKSRNFDVDGAKKSGYSSEEILSHLSPNSIAKPEAEKPSFGSRMYESTIGAIGAMADKYAKTPGANPIVRATEAFVVDPAIALAEQYAKTPGGNPYVRAGQVISDLIVPEQTRQDFADGNYGAGFGGLTGNTMMLLAPGALAKGAKAAPTTIRNMATAVRNPGTAIESSLPQRGTMQGTVAYAQKKGIPTTVGERTGSPMLQSAERMAEMTPGAAGTATDFFMDRNAQIMGEGAKLKQQVGKSKTVPTGSGAIEIDKTAAADAILERIEGRTADLKTFKDKKYGAVEKAIERNQAKLQAEADAQWKSQSREVKLENFDTLAKWIQENKRRAKSGYKGQLPEPQLKPLPEKPIVIGAEVELKPIQDKLRGLYEELTQTMPTTMKDASPGYTRLKAIVEEQKPSKSAMDLDRDLSEIKRVLRSEQKDYAATPSGRYAAATIDAIEGELQGAIERAGGKAAVDNLLKARSGVKEMHTALDALEQVLPKSQGPASNSSANLFNHLTQSGDTQINKLLEIKKVAPRALKDLGATYLDGALQKITGEAGQADLTAARNAYKRLGPRTKAELFGDMAPELDEFFRYAPDLIRNVNKSGSGYAIQAGKLLNVGGAMLGYLTGGLDNAATGAALTGGAMGSANAMAKFLFRKGNPTLVIDALKYPPESSAGKLAMKRLNAAAEKDPAISAWLASQNSGGSQNRP